MIPLYGKTIQVRNAEDLRKSLLARWRATRTTLPNNEEGWYRRLETNDRIGIVATAQGVISTYGVDDSYNFDRIFDTLLLKQGSDGSWSFITNMGDRGVVDATAWSILALVNDPRESTASSLVSAADWILDSCHRDGGWGICRGASFRTFSTALAIRSLNALQRHDHSEFQRGVQALLASLDGPSGLWNDFSNSSSVVATCHCIMALESLPSAGDYSEIVDRATASMVRTLNGSRRWSECRHLGKLEEVEQTIRSGRKIRIEYRHCAVEWAVATLIGRKQLPHSGSVLNEFSRILESGSEDYRGSSTVHTQGNNLTSYELHDTIQVLNSFLNHYAQDSKIWFTKSRVVTQPRHQLGARFWLKKYGGSVAVGLTMVSVFAVAYFVGSRQTFLETYVIPFAVSFFASIVAWFYTRDK